METIGIGAFSGFRGVSSIELPESLISIGDEAFKDWTQLTSLTLPESLQSIGTSAFYGCTGITSMIFPDATETIGEQAFKDCTGLAQVHLGSSLTEIGNKAFYGDTNLKKVYNKSNLDIVCQSTSNGYVAYYADEVIDRRTPVITYVTLTISSQGCRTEQIYQSGSEVKCKIIPAWGWTVNNVKCNGVSIMSKIDSDGWYTIPSITENTTIVIDNANSRPYDLNEDGYTDISDVNYLLDRILSGTR